MEKDVGFFFGVRQLEKFRKLLKYLSFNSGGLLKLSSAASTVGIDYKTLENYLEILSQTFVVSLVSPFFQNVSTELRKSRKIYFFDTGLRNSILNNFTSLSQRKDVGNLLENFVWIQLRQMFDEIKFWRTTEKQEVDFVCIKENKTVPVEVKMHEKKISRSLLKFIKIYEPETAVVFTLSRFDVEEIGKTKVAFLPHFYI